MTCSVASCGRPRASKGYCDAHYRRVRKFGDPLPHVPLTKGALQKKPPVRCRCEVCGVEFTKRKHQNGRYCSRACASKTAECVARIVCASRTSAARRGDMQRGRGEGKSYRKRDGQHEHRLVAQQKLGRPLQPGEVVHHLDGDIHNNAPENLVVITQSEHIRIHKPRRRRAAA